MVTPVSAACAVFVTRRAFSSAFWDRKLPPLMVVSVSSVVAAVPWLTVPGAPGRSPAPAGADRPAPAEEDFPAPPLLRAVPADVRPPAALPPAAPAQAARQTPPPARMRFLRATQRPPPQPPAHTTHTAINRAVIRNHFLILTDFFAPFPTRLLTAIMLLHACDDSVAQV